MSSTKIIKELESSEIAEALSFRNAFEGDNRTVEEWIWEYKGNYPDLYVYTIAKDSGRIVGTQGMIPIYLNVRGKRCLSGKSENSLLHPAYRGGTLFQEIYDSALAQCKIRDMQFVWGFTTAVRVWREKLGFSAYEHCLYYSIRIVNLQSALSKFRKTTWPMRKKSIMYSLATCCYLYAVASRFLLKFLVKLRKANNYSIEYHPRSMNDLTSLYERLRVKCPRLIYIEQDKDYLAWRLFRNPNIKYQTYYVYEDNLLKAYCYTGTNNQDKNMVSLSDFTFENAEAGTFLLESLLNKWHDEKIGIIYFFGNIKNPLMKTTFNLLERFGFLRRRHPMSIILRNISHENDDNLKDVEGWYANALWTEGFAI